MWFSVLVLPAKYPSSVLEVSVPVEVAKLQCQAQHLQTVLKAVPLVPPGTWLLMSVSSLTCTGTSGETLETQSELNHPERTETLKMGELEHSWEHFSRQQGWLNWFPFPAAHSDSHTVRCPLVVIWMSVQVEIMGPVSVTYTNISKTLPICIV